MEKYNKFGTKSPGHGNGTSSGTSNGTSNGTTAGASKGDTSGHSPAYAAFLQGCTADEMWALMEANERLEAITHTADPADWLQPEYLRELALCWHDPVQRARLKARYRKVRGDARDLEEAVKPYVAAAATPPQRPHAIRISARELLAKTFTPLTYVVEEILPAGCTVLTGKSKDGKSLMAYDLTVAVASGGKALGRYDVTQGSVWYMALEDGERRAKERVQLMQERCETALSDADLDRIAFTTWKAPRLGEGLEEDIIDWIENTPDARLLIIDILEKVRQPRKHHGNGYSDDYTPTATLTELAQERNIAILVIHHANKLNPDDFRDSASGCMSLLGGADNFWSLRRMPMSEEATLSITGRDIEREQELAMQFKDGWWTALGESHLVQMSKERQAIAEVLKASKRPLTPKQIAETLGKNYTTTKMLLRKMLEAGVIFQPTEGHYALSPTYTETTVGSVDPVDPIDSVDSVDSVDSPTQPLEKEDGCPNTMAWGTDDESTAAAGAVYGESTPVYGGSTAGDFAQPVENTVLNGDTVYGSTESMGFTEEREKEEGKDAPCYRCGHTESWLNAGGEKICRRCHPPQEGGRQHVQLYA